MQMHEMDKSNNSTCERFGFGEFNSQKASLLSTSKMFQIHPLCVSSDSTSFPSPTDGVHAVGIDLPWYSHGACVHLLNSTPTFSTDPQCPLPLLMFSAASPTAF